MIITVEPISMLLVIPASQPSNEIGSKKGAGYRDCTSGVMAMWSDVMIRW